MTISTSGNFPRNNQNLHIAAETKKHTDTGLKNNYKTLTSEPTVQEQAATKKIREENVAVSESGPSAGEIAKEVGLSLIPVYGTVREFQKGNIGWGIFGAVTDALTLIPFLGYGVKTVATAIRGGTVAVEVARAGLAAGEAATKVATMTVAKEFAAGASKGLSKSAPDLLKATARAIDPGFELLYDGGKFFGKKIKNIASSAANSGRSLENASKWKELSSAGMRRAHSISDLGKDFNSGSTPWLGMQSLNDFARDTGKLDDLVIPAKDTAACSGTAERAVKNLKTGPDIRLNKASENIAASARAGISKKPDKLTKEVYGQLFRGETLNHIYELCEHSAKKDYQAALTLISKKYKKSPEESKVLLEKIVDMLKESRVTVNFDLSKIEDINNGTSEIFNCFAFNHKPNEILNYNVGRAYVEQDIFDLNKIFNNSQYEKYGRFSKRHGDQTVRSADFQWTSRPCYAALDFMENAHGGAPMYGESFVVLKDHMKHNSTFSPFDTYSPPLLSSASKDKLSTFFHFPKLVKSSQNDLLGYNCLKSLVKKAKGESFIPHRNYGKSVGNYIETQVHSRILLSRDVKQISLSANEFHNLPVVKQKKMQAEIDKINKGMGFPFITFHGNVRA